MPNYVSIDNFLDLANSYPIVDVRAPIEFQRAHIPGAINIPLFDNCERATIGTIYRQQGRMDSVMKALELVGPRMHDLAVSIRDVAEEDHVLMHCWRGGMRSRSCAWLAEQVELSATVLQGGYKSFRKHVLQSFKIPLKLFVVSGLTGAGKTKQIQLLGELGEQVIDLEEMANHRGSAFGGIDQETQPAVEHFENQLFSKVSKLDMDRRIWIEDESRHIGSIRLPHHFFSQLRTAPAIFMDVDKQKRNELIFADYGGSSISALTDSVQRIHKRLGGQNVNQIVDLLHREQIESAIDLLLDYYDKLYLENKERIQRDYFADTYVDDPLSLNATHQLIEMADSFERTSFPGTLRNEISS